VIEGKTLEITVEHARTLLHGPSGSAKTDLDCEVSPRGASMLGADSRRGFPRGHGKNPIRGLSNGCSSQHPAQGTPGRGQLAQEEGRRLRPWPGAASSLPKPSNGVFAVAA
jgi:hypothetical protein